MYIRARGERRRLRRGRRRGGRGPRPAAQFHFSPGTPFRMLYVSIMCIVVLLFSFCSSFMFRRGLVLFSLLFKGKHERTTRDFPQYNIQCYKYKQPSNMLRALLSLELSSL